MPKLLQLFPEINTIKPIVMGGPYFIGNPGKSHDGQSVSKILFCTFTWAPLNKFQKHRKYMKRILMRLKGLEAFPDKVQITNRGSIR